MGLLRKWKKSKSLNINISMRVFSHWRTWLTINLHAKWWSPNSLRREGSGRGCPPFLSPWTRHLLGLVSRPKLRQVRHCNGSGSIWPNDVMDRQRQNLWPVCHLLVDLSDQFEGVGALMHWRVEKRPRKLCNSPLWWGNNLSRQPSIRNCGHLDTESAKNVNKLWHWHDFYYLHLFLHNCFF